MTFLLVFIFVALGILILFLKKIKWLIIITIFLFIIYLIIKIIKEKPNFKNNKKTSFKELCLALINQIDGYKKIIVKQNHIILISEYGIFIIFTIDINGKITGNKNDDKLILKYNKKDLFIPNIFIEQEKILSQYKLLSYKIEKYIIISNNCELLISNYNISKYRLFLNEFKRKYNTNILNKKEIDEIYVMLKDKL